MSSAPFARFVKPLTTALTLTLALGAATATLAQDIPTGMRINSIATGRDPNAGNYNARTNFILRCAGCHGMEGMGTASSGVPYFPDSVGHIAALEEGRTYILHVPGVISADLTNQQIADVMNYVLETYSDKPYTPFTLEEVNARRAESVPDIVVARRAIVNTLAAEGIYVADYPWP